jgi:copper chaperone
MTTNTLTIGGMTCSHCLRNVQQALNSMDAVKLDELRVGRAVVTFDETRVTADAVAEAVRDAGYEVLAIS